MKKAITRRLILVGWLLGLVVSTGDSVAAKGEIAIETFETFGDWCLDQKRLTPKARHTVKVLLAEAGRQACEPAEEKLMNLTELGIYEKGLTDIRPLASPTNLSELAQMFLLLPS